MKSIVALAVAALVLTAGVAAADVQRYAVIVGNNVGDSGDGALQYAESDASKVQSVLRDLGGFPPANIVLLRNEDAATARSTIISMNDRIRTAASVSGTQTLLFVYYSGHADAEALHLGASRFDFGELAQLVRGSAATFRLLVVDACRSGALTRVKGGRAVPAFALPDDSRLAGEGLAFLTASSANEDAQESDELRGSFFTHALVSGLLGAADENRDGAVSLQEAYNHAYGATLRATSRTFAGTQHPTFRYDFKGQSALVLTRLSAGARLHGMVSFPQGIGFLVMRDNADGSVVAEVGPRDRARSLSLRPGRYFLRGRGTDFLLEGDVSLSAGEARDVEPDALHRVEYARLVRKGGRSSSIAQGPELGVVGRTVLAGADTPCLGGALGYRLELEHVSFVARFGACTSRFQNEVLDARTNEYDGSLAALHIWDLSWTSVGVGLGGGAAVTTQTFETNGVAPSRASTAPYVLAALNFTFDVTQAIFFDVDARGETYFVNLQETSAARSHVVAAFALRGAVLGGVHF